MAIQKSVTIGFDIRGDASTTTMDIDLEHDPYSTLTNVLGVTASVEQENWLTAPRTNIPVGAKNGQTTLGHINFTSSLAYPILTLTFASAPGTGQDSLTVELLFN